MLKNRDQFVAAVSEIDAKCGGDRRHNMHGHHYMSLARWYLSRVAKDRSAAITEESFIRAFCGCVELDELDQYPLFQFLQRRVEE